MGFLPVRALHSETGLTSQTPQDSMNLISSARAAATNSGSKTAPKMSPRSWDPRAGTPVAPELSDCS
eukprot:4921512-Alexandrium_andersonii.AAC.1